MRSATVGANICISPTLSNKWMNECPQITQGRGRWYGITVMIHRRGFAAGKNGMAPGGWNVSTVSRHHCEPPSQSLLSIAPWSSIIWLRGPCGIYFTITCQQSLFDVKSECFTGVKLSFCAECVTRLLPVYFAYFFCRFSPSDRFETVVSSGELRFLKGLRNMYHGEGAHQVLPRSERF